MNVNLITLLGQMITFGLLVWFTMKFVWPPLMRAMEARQKTIADGLAAGERGKHDLEIAQQKAGEILREARAEAADTLATAGRHAATLIDEAKTQARAEGEKILQAARAEIERERNAAREQLRQQVGVLAVSGAARILEKEIDAKAHAKLIDGLVKEL